MTLALQFKDVDILFARGEGRARAAQIKAALSAIDAGRDRASVASENGVVVGVSGANLSVARGQISVLMGLSGSGKSTLLRAANGLNRITRGQVLVADGARHVDVAQCDATTLRNLRRNRIAMMFQQFGLLPWRTVRQNVGFGLELRGDPPATRQKIVDEKLELVGLAQWADRYVRELSGGMQQRVGLARAFATDADILLMDEPFSSLDALIRSKLQIELRALQQRVKKTILFVTHDLDEALKLGDQISVLQGGRIIQTGTPEDIVLRPATAYVAEFVQHMNPLSVLSGGMVMTAAKDLRRSNDRLWLDSAQQYSLQLDAKNQPRSLHHGGAELPNNGNSFATADINTPLRQLLCLLRDSGHPVLLTDSAGFCGVCSAQDVIRALAGSHVSSVAPDAAS